MVCFEVDIGDLLDIEYINGKEISFTKARELTRLTRKPLSTMVDRVKIVERGAKGKIVRGGAPAERTNEHFDAIWRRAHANQRDEPGQGHQQHGEERQQD